MAAPDRNSEDPQKFGQNPFAALSSEGLPPGPEQIAEPAATPKKSRGRVDIIRQTAGRGGKTVTVVTNFVGIGLPEKEKLAKQMQKACGTGGTVKEGRIEIQGDKRFLNEDFRGRNFCQSRDRKSTRLNSSHRCISY